MIGVAMESMVIKARRQRILDRFIMTGADSGQSNE
jgi:hypothetical protein